MLIALPVVSGNSYPMTFICLDHSFSGNRVLLLSFPLVFHPLHKMLVTSELQVIMVLNKKKKIVRQDRFTCPFSIWRIPWNGGRGKRKVAHPLWKETAACVTASFISEHLITCRASVSPRVSTLWDGTSTNAVRKLSFTSYWTKKKKKKKITSSV